MGFGLFLLFHLEARAKQAGLRRAVWLAAFKRDVPDEPGLCTCCGL